MASGKSELHSPKWASDKKLAHPTKERTDSFNYNPFLNIVVPKLRLVIAEFERLENVQRRNFETR
jgi:hypothetical protein